MGGTRESGEQVSNLVFVYGTLKEGFSNFEVNSGVRVPGEFVTVERYPLYVLGPLFLPWLVDAPGEGHHVIGQLFEVDAAGLARMDRLERIDESHWYRRGSVLVHRRTGSPTDSTTAMVYFGSEFALRSETVHFGPIAEYTRLHDTQNGENGP